MPIEDNADAQEVLWKDVIDVVMSEMSKMKAGAGSAATIMAQQRACEADINIFKVLETYGWNGHAFGRTPVLWPQLAQALLRGQRTSSPLIEDGGMPPGGGLGGAAAGDHASAFMKKARPSSSFFQPRDPISRILDGGG